MFQEDLTESSVQDRLGLLSGAVRPLLIVQKRDYQLHSLLTDSVWKEIKIETLNVNSKVSDPANEEEQKHKWNGIDSLGNQGNENMDIF
jgi:hypothetical protein